MVVCPNRCHIIDSTLDSGLLNHAKTKKRTRTIITRLEQMEK